MSARADVRANILRRGVEIYVSPEPGQVIVWEPVVVEPLDDGIRPGSNHILNLPEDSARALYEALNRYYAGNDAGTQRSDFLHERGRVDNLITAMLERL